MISKRSDSDQSGPWQSIDLPVLNFPLSSQNGCTSQTSASTANISQQSPYTEPINSTLSRPIIHFPHPTFHALDSAGDPSILATGIADRMERDEMGLARAKRGQIRYLVQAEHFCPDTHGILAHAGRYDLSCSAAGEI